jgi:hypothetical protein
MWERQQSGLIDNDSDEAEIIAAGA